MAALKHNPRVSWAFMRTDGSEAVSLIGRA